MLSSSTCSVAYLHPQLSTSYDSNAEATKEKHRKLIHVVLMVLGIALLLSALLTLIFLNGSIGVTFGSFGAVLGGVILIALGACSMIRAQVIKEASIKLTLAAQNQSNLT
ncbi:hypothetical protein CLAVI_000671 [Candidatus Clavichlamydia salmonicola]|uniref:hypothetical protein n=1 Tax=Candidatus Clavichlamydia salmonicola TaxID=469812 RepID=UPI00189115B0|nr:hypothetical protein [Candidatus Clavichlamydia salmonicola]MBF5051043.1 hypothetical protein [Candidatus Clavichlamydia salmonicola]